MQMWRMVIDIIVILSIIKLIHANLILQKSYSDDFTNAEKQKIRECLNKELYRQQICQNTDGIKEMKYLITKWDIVSEYSTEL